MVEKWRYPEKWFNTFVERSMRNNLFKRFTMTDFPFLFKPRCITIYGGFYVDETSARWAGRQIKCAEVKM